MSKNQLLRTFRLQKNSISRPRFSSSVDGLPAVALAKAGTKLSSNLQSQMYVERTPVLEEPRIGRTHKLTHLRRPSTQIHEIPAKISRSIDRQDFEGFMPPNMGGTGQVQPKPWIFDGNGIANRPFGPQALCQSKSVCKTGAEGYTRLLIALFGSIIFAVVFDR
jgi:hypothetical protein